MSQVMSKASDMLTQKRAEKIQREQAEAEANARELWLKMQEHQRRFICHVDGCTNTSMGPKLEEFLGHWLWDWHQPTGLVLCDRCICWTCTVHLSGGICHDCLSG
jgi:hypothetical protein